MGPLHHLAYRFHQVPGPGWVAHGGRLVQKQQTRPHGQNPGQGQSLGLAAGQVGGGTVPLQVFQTDLAQAFLHPAGDIRPAQPQILRPEGHVISQTFENRLRLGVLHEQTGRAYGLPGRLPADQEGAFAQPPLLVFLTGLSGSQQPGHSL